MIICPACGREIPEDDHASNGGCVLCQSLRITWEDFQKTASADTSATQKAIKQEMDHLSAYFEQETNALRDTSNIREFKIAQFETNVVDPVGYHRTAIKRDSVTGVEETGEGALIYFDGKMVNILDPYGEVLAWWKGEA